MRCGWLAVQSVSPTLESSSSRRSQPTRLVRGRVRNRGTPGRVGRSCTLSSLQQCPSGSLRHQHANARDGLHVFLLALLEVLLKYYINYLALFIPPSYRCQQTRCRRRFVTFYRDEGYRPWPAPKCLYPTVNFARARNNRAATILCLFLSQPCANYVRHRKNTCGVTSFNRTAPRSHA